MRCSLAVNIRNVFWVIGLRKLFFRLNGYGIKYIFVVVYVAGIVLKVSDFEAYGYVASAFPSGVKAGVLRHFIRERRLIFAACVGIPTGKGVAYAARRIRCIQDAAVLICSVFDNGAAAVHVKHHGVVRIRPFGIQRQIGVDGSGKVVRLAVVSA